MLKNLKLKERMLLGYAIPIAIYLGFAGIVYSSANQVSAAFNQVRRIDRALIQSSQLAFQIQTLIRTTRGYLLDSDEVLLTRYEAAKAAIQESAKLTQELIIRPEQKERLAKMLALTKEYEKVSDELIRLQKQGKTSEVRALYAKGEGKQLIQEFVETYDAFNQAQQELLDLESTQAQDSVRAMILALVIGSLLITVLAIAIALAISAGITKTINEATNAIASSSTEIAATVEQHERTASQQATSVHQTTITMDELAASSRQSAEQAESAAAGARQVFALATTGTQAVGETLEDMALLKSKVEAIAQEILRLNEHTNEIGTISTLVSELANQTNMLALNAAVEAVRAGDQGKGFAVIAGEIRKLADRSKQSAAKINTLVTDIESAINSTVSVTHEGSQTVEKGVTKAHWTAETFASVREEINGVVLSSQQISLTAKQQSIAIEQVVDAMNTINLGAAETASGICQTKAGTQKLNEAALHLQQVV